MLNTKQYNWQQYNNNLLYNWLVIQGISFDGFWLQNDTYCIHTTNWDNIANIDINSFSNPQDDGWFILSRYYKDKSISMRGTITASTVDWLVTAIDNLKDKLSKVEWYLYVQFGSKYRKIKATVSDINIQRNHYNVTFVEFTIEFLCKEPFFSDLNVWTESYLAQTASIQDDINYIGTGETYPSIYVVFESAWGVTGVDIVIGDKTIATTWSFPYWSVLIVDGDKKTVTLNWLDIDYIWSIGKLVSWSNIVEINITGGSYLYDCNIVYDIKYK